MSKKNYGDVDRVVFPARIEMEPEPADLRGTARFTPAIDRGPRTHSKL